MNSLSKFANRLALLRNQHGYTQEELAEVLSEMQSRKKAISNLSVSGWETNDKFPPVATIISMCKLFNVSSDYLLGLSDDIGSSDKISAAATETKGIKPDYHIPLNDIASFDKEPVYVVFKNKQATNRWGIVDMSVKRIIFPDATLSFKNAANCIIYSIAPSDERHAKYNLKRPLSLSQINKSETVWIEMISPAPEIKALYNGWYKHNEDHTALINSRGLALPYEGLSISYNAYSSDY